MSALHIIFQGDAVHTSVALVLLSMSVVAWFVIFWKGWLLQRASRDVSRSTAAFWQSPDMQGALLALPAFDREGLVLPLVQASQVQQSGTLASAGDRGQQLTRVLRDALHGVLGRLQFGQVLLATVGSTAPFVGLLGTVWGIYHAMLRISSEGSVGIDQIAGPVGEALVMTAAGLAVAIPAVLAYNLFGKRIAQIEADLEGFALDLRDTLLSRAD